MKASQIWYLVLKEIEKNYYLSNTSYLSFIQVLTPICVKDNFLVIMGPNLFTINIVNRKYADFIDSCVKAVNPELSFLLISPEEAENYEAEEYERRLPEENLERPQLNPKFTFENFVVGKSNSYAHATAFAISQNPGRAFNPFFIYGKSGLGKTHLIQAIAHEILKNNPNYKLWYVSAEQFTNELVHSIKSGKNEVFRQRYRNLDCLMIDDIQFLEDKEGIQGEFFHTFNQLFSNGSQIIIASDRLPREIKSLSDRLTTRFESGVVVDVVMPDIETRVAILQSLNELEKYEIPDHIIGLLASNVDTSIRELEGSLKRVNAYAVLGNEKPSEEIVNRVLEQMKLEKVKNAPIEPITIIETVAKEFDVKPEDIRGRRKTNDITLARHVSMYITRELTNLSYPGIGYEFGRDHSSVIYACDKIKELTTKDKALKRRIDKLIKEIKK